MKAIAKDLVLLRYNIVYSDDALEVYHDCENEHISDDVDFEELRSQFVRRRVNDLIGSPESSSSYFIMTGPVSSLPCIIK